MRDFLKKIYLSWYLTDGFNISVFEYRPHIVHFTVHQTAKRENFFPPPPRPCRIAEVSYYFVILLLGVA